MVDLVELSNKNLGQVRLLSAHCFPVVYRDSFFEQLLMHAEFVRLGYLADCLVGAIACKLDDLGNLYLMLLGVLVKYRRSGIASELLQWVIAKAHATPSISQVCLHVQTSNLEGLSFYEKFGFQILHTCPDYYPQLDVASAHYLVLRIEK